MLESFQGVGKIPCSKELLKMRLNGLANIDNPSFSKRGLIRSGPQAFEILKFSKTSVTSCTEILIDCSHWCCSDEVCGNGWLLSFTSDCNAK